MYEQTIKQLSADQKTYAEYAGKAVIFGNEVLQKGLTQVFQSAAQSSAQRLKKLQSADTVFKKLGCALTFQWVAGEAEKTAASVLGLLKKKEQFQTALQNPPDLNVLQEQWNWKLETVPDAEKQKWYISEAISYCDGELAKIAGSSLSPDWPKAYEIGNLYNAKSSSEPSELESAIGVGNIMIGKGQPTKYIPRSAPSR